MCAGDTHSAVRAKETGTPMQAGIGRLCSLIDGLWSRAQPCGEAQITGQEAQEPHHINPSVCVTACPSGTIATRNS